MSQAPLTEALADFVVGAAWEQLPAEVQAMTVRLVYDGTGALLAAANPAFSTGRLIARQMDGEELPAALQACDPGRFG